MRFAYVGATSRRYPSDIHQGLCARYGIWDAWGDWEPAYAKDEDGVIDMYPWTGTWSPFGEGWSCWRRPKIEPRMRVVPIQI